MRKIDTTKTIRRQTIVALLQATALVAGLLAGQFISAQASASEAIPIPKRKPNANTQIVQVSAETDANDSPTLLSWLGLDEALGLTEVGEEEKFDQKQKEEPKKVKHTQKPDAEKLLRYGESEKKVEPYEPKKAKHKADKKDKEAVVVTKAERRSLPEKILPPLKEHDGELSKHDLDLYRDIFATQERGEFDEADDLISKLDDQRLLGHVWYQRYMSVGYHANFAELKNWLKRYADHPGANKVYAMAQTRKPNGVKASLVRPQGRSALPAPRLVVAMNENGRVYRTEKNRTGLESSAVLAFSRQIKSDLNAKKPEAALHRLKVDQAAKFLDTVEEDRLRADIANYYLVKGDINKAEDLALTSARRSGNKAPMAGWVGGLASWRMGHYGTAAALFEQTAKSSYTSSWMDSAASYWAARAHSRIGRDGQTKKWLEKAAANPRTFYGMIATRALGRNFDFNWVVPQLTAAQEDQLDHQPHGRRALALAAIGQRDLAARELTMIEAHGDVSLQQAMLSFSVHNGLPDLAMSMAAAVPHPNGGMYDGALYPVAPWEPQDGFKIDQALLHALMRQESKFNPKARSNKGAQGLMQIMPSTARFILASAGGEGDEKTSLQDPVHNMDLGQQYIQTLLQSEDVNGDLFALAVAYNAGPGNLKQWKKNLGDAANDPLLFIESIPAAETRDFVEKVMANYWLYCLQMKQKIPSLDAVAKGQVPIYTASK